MPIRKFAATVAVLVTGLTLSASAKDNSPSGGGGTPTVNTGGRDSKTISQAKSRPKARHWFQVGTASWYGVQFQGRKTAGGESFDMNGMTCAHPSLPMGTWLKVTNLKNRRTAFVRVNDRGPVIDGRIVDLSAAAARTLGLVGVGKVRLDALRDGDTELAKALVAQVQFPTLALPWAVRPASLVLSPR